MALITFSVADTSLLVGKIIFVVALITFKLAVITSLVVKIIFIVVLIIFKVAVITSSVVKISFNNGSRKYKRNNKHLYHIKSI